jgi:hypothetical protein
LGRSVFSVTPYETTPYSKKDFSKETLLTWSIIVVYLEYHKGKKMINMNFNVRELLVLVSKGCDENTFEKIVTAFETAIGQTENRTVVVTKGSTQKLPDRVAFVKDVRARVGLTLKDAVFLYDVVNCGKEGEGRIVMDRETSAQKLLNWLKTFGCDGYLTT